MATKKATGVQIKPIKEATYVVRVVGDTPLIMHRWDEKGKRQLLENMQKTNNGKEKEPKNPVVEFIDSMYWLTEKPDVNCYMDEEECEKLFMDAIENGAKFGFPVTAFKQAAISAAYRLGWSKDKMSLRGVFFIESDVNGLVEIKSDPPIMREDITRIGMGKPDLRYRGEFRNWYADLVVKFNINGNYDIGSIINIINAGGYVCGVGEWRPERDGQYGMFHVEPNK
jgi:hypothetical protein